MPAVDFDPESTTKKHRSKGEGGEGGKNHTSSSSSSSSTKYGIKESSRGHASASEGGSDKGESQSAANVEVRTGAKNIR
jgi:hypothetical protein